jgi:Uma2 family endonuclease
MEALTVKIPPQYPMTDDELFAFCAANQELRIERDENGQLILMSPTGSSTGHLNFRLTSHLGNWVQLHPNLGYGFDSSTGFRLPDGSMRSPDVSWISREKWDKISVREREKFAPVCPDFVIELASPSDSVEFLTKKMEAWIRNGCRLGWLIDPASVAVHVFTSEGRLIVTGRDQSVAGDPVLPGFRLELRNLL